MDELERRIARSEWLWSQYRWHTKRRAKTWSEGYHRWDWHRRQQAWYRRQARKAASFMDHMVYSLRDRGEAIRENVEANHALLERIKEMIQ